MVEKDFGEQGALGRAPIMARPVAAATPASPLNEDDYLAIRRAVQARRPVRKAAKVAHGSATTILFAGAIGAVFLVFSFSLVNAVVALTLCTMGYLERLGARKMERGLPEAATHLGWNQIAFIGLITFYCIDCMMEASPTKMLSPEVKSQLSASTIGTDLEAMVSGLTRLVYVLVIVLSALGQGALALYYFTRRHCLLAVQQSTPQWIRRVIDEVVA